MDSQTASERVCLDGLICPSCQVSVRLWQSEVPDIEVLWRGWRVGGCQGSMKGHPFWENQTMTRWWFQTFFYFHPKNLGNDPFLTNIFSNRLYR